MISFVFLVAKLGADSNTRSGGILCSDIYLACSFGDRTLTEILIECGGYVNILDRNGKTPLIYALEYPSSNSTFDLISCLIERDAQINFKDQNDRILQTKEEDQREREEEDISVENAIDYNILRYALSCLSYISPLQCIEYKIDSSLCYAIIGNNCERIFIFYSLIRQRNDLEKFAWNIFININLTKEIFDSIQIIMQIIFVYSHYFSHIIYLCQRFKIENYLFLLIYYIERVTLDEKPNRFLSTFIFNLY